MRAPEFVAHPATERQLALIRKLADERDWGAGTFMPADDHVMDVVDGLQVSKREASAAIDALLRAPVKVARQAVVAGVAAPAAAIEPGIYYADGAVIKVQKAVHGSGHPYAKRLSKETGRFEYAPGLIRQLRPEQRMTLEQAKEYGELYGVCCNCGRTLTNEVSIEAGIGPVCRKKFIII